MIGTFIMQFAAFITSISQDRIKAYFLHTNKSYIFREQFLLHAPMTTYFKDLTQSIGRYSGLSWQNWFKVCLDASSISNWCKRFGQQGVRSKINMLEDA